MIPIDELIKQNSMLIEHERGRRDTTGRIPLYSKCLVLMYTENIRYLRALEFINEYKVDIWLMSQCDYDNYIRIRRESMIEEMIHTDSNECVEDVIPEKIFCIVKDVLKL